MRSNPLFSIALGVLLLALSFVVGGTTRDFILRAAGLVAILAGAVMLVLRRR